MNRRLLAAVAFTFAAHGLAMLLMAGLLMPMLPGGGGGGDAERVARIAASPLAYRLGWFGWQLTAASDVVLGVTLFLATKDGRARAFGIAQLVFVGLAVIPDQLAQFLLVTRGVELARSGDVAAFLAFETEMFPLTSGWAAILYTLAAIGWALALRTSGRWSRVLAWLTPPMLLLFVAISIAPVVPLAIRPSAELIGAGNAVAFTLLEAWFVAVFVATRRARAA
ncbi:MAG TPA: hypothetical protein VIF62_02565 [Labilithrix sp.]